jgi:hypothetical protein
VNKATGLLATVRRLSMVIAIAIVFAFGLGTTVILSLRSPEVKVPDVVGKDRFEAERVLGDAGLNFRVRATRPTAQMKADTVLFQLPRAGEVVKAGQTVAMDISRTVKEGESSEAVPTPEEKPTTQANESAANENKPRRNKNTNRNGNENANDNTGNRNANANRISINKNANANSNGTNANSNRPALNINNSANRTGNQNSNVRPAAPKPSPVAKPTHPNP